MPEHYPTNTKAVLSWCDTCQRRTSHKVTNHRLSDCTEHKAEGLSKKQEKARAEREAAEKEPELFG